MANAVFGEFVVATRPAVLFEPESQRKPSSVVITPGLTLTLED